MFIRKPHHTHALLLALAAALSLAACDEKKTPSPTTQPDATKPPATATAPAKQPATNGATSDAPGEKTAADDDTKAPGAGREPAVKTLPEADVKQLAQAWLKAQNDGDFKAYAATYAKKMFGIKRIGARTYRYDRAGWLKDRKRMFRKKMVVSADTMKVSASSSAAVVRFTQTWTSGTFKDVGPKQLVIVREGKTLRIAREEMLASTLVNTRAEARLDPALATMVVRHKKYLAVVIDPAVSKKARFTRGPARIIQRGYAARRAVNIKKLPAAQAAWRDRKVKLYGATGEVCEVKVKRLDYYAHVIPHFGQVQTWNGEMGDERTSDRGVARGIWGLADDAISLVAVLEDNPACKGAVWGRDAAKPAPHVYPLYKKSKMGDPNLHKSFGQLHGVKAQQGAHLKDGGKGPWFKGNTQLRFFRARGRGAHPFYFYAAAKHDGCGVFSADFWGVWRRTPGGYELLSDPKNVGGWFVPDAVADVDGDGSPELFGDRKIARKQGAVIRIVQDFNPPSFDCPC